MRRFLDIVMNHVHEVDEFDLFEALTLALHRRNEWVNAPRDFNLLAVVEEEEFALADLLIHLFVGVLFDLDKLRERRIGAGNNRGRSADDTRDARAVVLRVECLCLGLDCRIREVYDSFVIGVTVREHGADFSVFRRTHSLDPCRDSLRILILDARDNEPVKVSLLEPFEHFRKVGVDRYFLSFAFWAARLWLRWFYFALAIHNDDLARRSLIAFQRELDLFFLVLCPRFRDVVNAINMRYVIRRIRYGEYHSDSSALWTLNCRNTFFLERDKYVRHLKSHKF